MTNEILGRKSCVPRVRRRDYAGYMRFSPVRKMRSVLGGIGFASMAAKFKDFTEEARFIRTMIEDGTRNLALREHTLRIVFPACAARDKRAQALAVAEWVQQNITYVHEGAETFQRPETTLRLKAGDCDDQTILILSMLGTIGIKGKACIIAINGRWAHIFPVALIPTPDGLHRLTLDTTLTEPVAELVNPIEKVERAGKRVTKTMFV